MGSGLLLAGLFAHYVYWLDMLAHNAGCEFTLHDALISSLWIKTDTSRPLANTAG